MSKCNDSIKVVEINIAGSVNITFFLNYYIFCLQTKPNPVSAPQFNK